MIHAQALLTDLRKLLARLEADLRERCREVPEVAAGLQREYEGAKAARRVGDSFEAWRDDRLTQAAVAWILGCVFVRFLEDNGLVEAPRLSGPPKGGSEDRLQLARDHHTHFFQQHPTQTDREYLLDVFEGVRQRPAAGSLFHKDHNPLWGLALSGDGAGELLAFWQKIDPATGTLVHDFSDPDWNTRFLGDLYQDLSEGARKKYALLQTPEFVEEFLLDRTLTPAVAEFGYRVVRLLDPTCGSGHFLLGGFHRLFDLWVKNEPGTHTRELAQRALDGVYGVDLNPFAVAIARFRLLVAALRVCGVEKLRDAPGFRLHLAAGDSLLHGPGFRRTRATKLFLDPTDDPIGYVFQTEDRDELLGILGQQYHAVVGNPPYITVKDAALNQRYRDRFPESCHRQYSLGAPFTERFFELALSGNRSGGEGAGFVGLITANSFMKREFGKKLIEEVMPRLDLTHVLDTSGAYIPGHGTPTVILFGRHRDPVAKTVRAVLGIKGEPSTPEDPAKGLVWSAICAQVDVAGSESDFVSVTDTPRATFGKHPWSVGGGGASDLLELLSSEAKQSLESLGVDIGRTTHTGEDDAFYFPPNAARTRGFQEWCVPLVIGEGVRDFQITPALGTVFPYDKRTGETAVIESERLVQHFWTLRTTLKTRRDFGQTPEERGLRWVDHSMFFRNRYANPLSLTFAFVATHNHFVLDRGGKVFNRTAPVIKLPKGATEDDHLALLGLLNSSTACFWMKQVCMGKHKGDGGEAHADPAYQRFEFDGTKLLQFPLPPGTLLPLARELDRLGQALVDHTPAHVAAAGVPSAERLRAARAGYDHTLAQLLALQEELDWQCYGLYGLPDAPSPPAPLPQGARGAIAPPPRRGEGLGERAEAPGLNLGERAFEIVLARKLARGEVTTAWFERHGSTPLTDLPAHWPADYRDLVQRRIDWIEADRNIALIEKPEYKRRWNTEPWEEQEKRALRGWLLDRLEDPRHWPAVEFTSCSRLADRVRRDPEFVQVAELYRGRPDFDLTALVVELAESEAVPFLPVLRYQPSGLRKREVWERTWELQRREDAGETLPIPVPPKYQSADFLGTTFWRLRGKLDVPKERFTSYPHCGREADPTPVLGWAGWNPLEQAQALAAHYLSLKESEGWTAERLTPLLAGLLELLPWLHQWHNDLDPAYHVRQGDTFRDFLDEELRALGLTRENLRAWTPAARTRSRKRRTE